MIGQVGSPFPHACQSLAIFHYFDICWISFIKSLLKLEAEIWVARYGGCTSSEMILAMCFADYPASIQCHGL